MEPCRDKRLYLANLADQAERFDEMADRMAAVCNLSNELSAAEHNFFLWPTKTPWAAALRLGTASTVRS